VYVQIILADPPHSPMYQLLTLLLHTHTIPLEFRELLEWPLNGLTFRSSFNTTVVSWNQVFDGILDVVIPDLEAAGIFRT